MMVNLLKIEWLKIKNYPAFWWILGITALSYIGVGLSSLFFYQQLLKNPQIGVQGAQMIFGNPFSYQEVWHTVAYLSSLLVTIPALLVIMLVTNEYTFKTHRQNVMDGWSRAEFVAGKLLDVLVVSVIITLIYIAVCLTIGGDDVKVEMQDSSSKLSFIFYFLLQTFAQLSIAFALGIFIRRSFMALGIFIFWSIILEPILTKALPVDRFSVGSFLPFEISDRIVPPPTFLSKLDPKTHQFMMEGIGDHVLYTFAFIVLIWSVCFRWYAKRDL